MKRRNPEHAGSESVLRMLLTVLLFGMTVFVVYTILRSSHLSHIDLIRRDTRIDTFAELQPGEVRTQSVYVYRGFDQIILFRRNDAKESVAEVRICQRGETICSERIIFAPGQTARELVVSGSGGTLEIHVINRGESLLALPLIDSKYYDVDYLTTSEVPLLQIRVVHFSSVVRWMLVFVTLSLCLLAWLTLWGWGEEWNRRKAILFIIILCFVYLILFPAWNINDFSAHFSTAYAISSRVLGIQPVDENNRLMVREDDQYYFRYVFAENLTQEENFRVFYQPARRSYDDAAFFLFQPSERNRPVAAEFDSQTLDGYGFWNYIPFIIGLLLTRLLSLNLVTAVFLGRLLGIAFCMAGIYIALGRMSDSMAVPVSVLSCLPVCTMNFTAVSYDPLCYVLTLLLTACVLSLREKYRLINVLLLAGSCLMLGLVKGGAYALLSLTVLLLPHRNDRKKNCIVVCCLLAGVLGLVINYRHLFLGQASYFQFGQAGRGTYSPGWALQHPLDYMIMAGRTYIRKADQIFLIGSYLGWNHKVLPGLVCILFYVLILLGSVYTDRERNMTQPLKGRERGWILFPVFLIVAGTPAMMLSSTDVGSELIEGMQGRYFLPLLFPAIVLIRYRPHGRNIIQGTASAYVLWGAGFLSLVSVWYIATVFLI